MGELWAVLESGDYSVSNLGRIKRVTAYCSTKPGKIVKQRLGSAGYFGVVLSSRGKLSQFSVHRLVARHFLNADRSRPQVNHKDGNKTNNRADNLEYVTAAENKAHSVANGTSKTGARHYKAKFTDSDISAIRESRDSHRIEATKYGVAHSTISRIRRQETWKHL